MGLGPPGRRRRPRVPVRRDGRRHVVRVHRLGRDQPSRQLGRARQLPEDPRRSRVARRARAHARARVRVRRSSRTRSASRSRSRCNGRVKTRGLLRALFFLPVVMSSLAVSYVWQFIFSYAGPLNGLLGALGLESLEARMDGRPDLGALDDLRRARLAVRRPLDGHVPRRPRGDPRGARRGVGGRRRVDVPSVPEGHAAAARAGDHGERHAEHDLRARGVRPGASRSRAAGPSTRRRRWRRRSTSRRSPSAGSATAPRSRSC